MAPQRAIINVTRGLFTRLPHCLSSNWFDAALNHHQAPF
jgi:hypothetical protein